MKILFLRRKGKETLGAARHYHAFEQKVGEFADCKWAGRGWPLYQPRETVDETVQRVMPDVDWVLDRERDEKSKTDRSYYVGAYLSDLHSRGSSGIRNDPEKYIEVVNQVGYDAIFLKYEEVHNFDLDPRIFMNKLDPRTFFLPWSIDTEKFKPKKSKRWDVGFLGAGRGGTYPFRAILREELLTFCEKRGLRLLFKRKPRGLSAFTNQQLYEHPDYYFGPRYADALSKIRFFIFGCSIFRYPLVKYFEAMAAGCTVVANEPSSAKKLGFIDRENYVCITKDNWKEKLDYYLDNLGEAQKIASAGRKLMIDRHTHEIRAKQFLNMLKTFEAYRL